MTTRRQQPGLGRGLGELFANTDPAATKGGKGGTKAAEPAVAIPEGSSFAEIPVASIRPNPKQPRAVFDPYDLEELRSSIAEVGLLQPVVVRPLADNNYELVMGERRLRASQLAGWDTIPAIIRPTEEGDLLRDALLENLHRAQLNPLEEAAAYQQLLNDFSCTQEELSQRIHRSRSQISNTIRLLNLPPAVQRRVASGVLSAGHARALLALEDPKAQESLATRIVAEGMSVRDTEEAVTLDRGKVAKPRRNAQPKQDHPRAHEVSTELGDLLDTEVRVDIGKNRGRIVIDFAGEEDLDRIVGILQRKKR